MNVYYLLILIAIILVFTPLLLSTLNILRNNYYIYYIIFYITATTMLFPNIKIFLEARDTISRIEIKKPDNVNVLKHPLLISLTRIYRRVFSISLVRSSLRKPFPNTMFMKQF